MTNSSTLPYLARLVQELELSPTQLDNADPATLRAFCRAVLEELTAHGYLEAELDGTCWAQGRKN